MIEIDDRIHTSLRTRSDHWTYRNEALEGPLHDMKGPSICMKEAEEIGQDAALDIHTETYIRYILTHTEYIRTGGKSA